MAVRYSGFLSVPQKEVAVVPATSFDIQESYHYGWQARVEVAIESDLPIPAGSLLSAVAAKGVVPGRQVIVQPHLGRVPQRVAGGNRGRRADARRPRRWTGRRSWEAWRRSARRRDWCWCCYPIRPSMGESFDTIRNGLDALLRQSWRARKQKMRLLALI